MNDYNDYVLQGISLRLNTYENFEENPILFNTKNRCYLSPKNIAIQNDYYMTNEYNRPLINTHNYSINNYNNNINITYFQKINPIQSDYFNHDSNNLDH